MIATGTVYAGSTPIQLRGLPNREIRGHATLKNGVRVTIGAEGDLFGAPGWVLVKSGDRIGWVVANTVKRDPLLFVDLSHYNGAAPNMKAIVNAGYMAIGLKATESTRYEFEPWYLANVPRVVEAFGDRFGDTGHLLAYHYFREIVDGGNQARYFARTMRKASRLPTIRPVVDVENGVDKKKLVAGLKEFWKVMIGETGQVPILYGGSLLRELKIKGSDIAKPAPDPWVAEYGPELKEAIFAPLGYTRSKIFAWQYAGGDKTVTPTTPNFGKLPHGVPGLAGQLPDTNIILGAKDIAEVVKKYGWK